MNDPWPRPTQGPAKTIETDYLVIGAGAMGMAFTDTLITESGARVVMIDRACQPGGHWTTAYPFVRLHQPSAYYGVNSRALGNNTIDLVGWNQGLNELAPVGEICAYFDAVLQQQLLPTGRVDYFPMSEYLGDGRFRTLAGTEYVVTVNRRIVDATYLRAVVPSMRPAPYSVAPGVDCVAPNELPKLGTRDRYVVVGAGKTGMDVCLWLLRNDVCPDKLTWIMPRDSWLIDRATLQPGPTFVRQFRESYGATLEAIGAATSTDDLFDRLETAGTLLRIDPSVRPSMYRCATVSHLELEQLRRIRDIVRMGHVQRIEPTTIVLDGGSVPATPTALYIDCTADGAPQRPAKPVFDADHLTPASRARMPTGVQRRVYRARRIRLRGRRGEKRTLYPDSTPGLRSGLDASDALRSRQLSALVKRPRSDGLAELGAVELARRPAAAVVSQAAGARAGGVDVPKEVGHRRRPASEAARRRHRNNRTTLRIGRAP